MHKLSILLIEDDESFAWVVERAIRSSFAEHTVLHVSRITAGLEALSNNRFDVVLTDLSLPDAAELESIQQLRAFNPDIPLIVLTSLESQHHDAQALKAGAQDYIVKDLMTPQLLDRTIWHAIERQKIQTENQLLIRELVSQRAQLNAKNEKLQQVVATAHRFVDNVSHEFRTPLTVIREYAALLNDGLLGEVTPEQSEFLDVIRYRVDDLNTMVDDMLDSSKLAAGIMGMHRVPTSVQSIVERPLQGLHLKAQVRGVNLCFDGCDDLPLVFCDPEKAGRVITNLVSNAIKFCDDGVGMVKVKAQYIQMQQNVEISVIDNGPGIEPEDLDLLFERFRQLGTGTQSSTKGFGLGLNIARELVDQNFGVISVESKVDCGTAFRFTIPVDSWPEIVSRFAVQVARSRADASIAVLHATATGDTDQSMARDIDAFWRFTDRQPDLVRRTAQNVWTLLVTCDATQIEEIVDSFRQNHAKVNRNRTKPMASLNFITRGCFAIPEGRDHLLSAACSESKLLELPTSANGSVNTTSTMRREIEIPAPAFLKTRSDERRQTIECDSTSEGNI